MSFLTQRGAKALTLAHWPRILTSKAQLLLFNNVWSLVPELSGDFVRLAAIKRLIVAERTAPEPARVRIFNALDIVTVSECLRGGIQISCRRFEP